MGAGVSLSNPGFVGGLRFVAVGGTVSEVTEAGVTYRVHTFNTSGTFQVLSGSAPVHVLTVAGGGHG